jgi:hypothetical protein
MYDRVIAEQLRRRGHDVVAVTERAELRSVSDADLLVRMAREGRVVVTENAADFVSAFGLMIQRGEACAGVMIASPQSMPRRGATIGLFVEVLDRELAARPQDDALDGQLVFVAP